MAEPGSFQDSCMTSEKGWWDDQPTLYGFFKNFFNGTTLHGYPRIWRPQPVWLRLLWLIACLGLSAVTIWQIVKLVKDYREYPTSTSSVLTFKSKVEFPAFTVCPLNPIKISRMYNSRFATPKLQQLMRDQIAAWSEDNSSLPYLSPHEWTPDDLNAGQFLDLEAIHHAMLSSDWEDLANKIYEVPPSIEETGYFCNQADEFILFCSITAEGGYDFPCSAANFTTRLNDEYCTCFEFTPDEPLLAQRPGNSYFHSDTIGAWVYSDTMEWNPVYTGGVAALRFMIHPKRIHAFPQVAGEFVQIGAVHFFGVVERTISRQPTPWGECDEKQYRTTIPCQQHLISAQIIEQCGCYNPYVLSPNEFGNYTEGVLDAEGSAFIPECTGDDWGCVYEVYTQDELPVVEGDVPCSRQICKEVTYQQEASGGPWPTKEFLQSWINDDIQEYMDYFGYPSKDNLTQDEIDTIVKNNEAFAKTTSVFIYFKELNRQEITETKAVTAVQLLSNIGGILGLFLGASVATGLELFELFFFFLRRMIVGACCSVAATVSPTSKANERTSSHPKRVIVGAAASGHETGSSDDADEGRGDAKGAVFLDKDVDGKTIQGGGTKLVVPGKGYSEGE